MSLDNNPAEVSQAGRNVNQLPVQDSIRIIDIRLFVSPVVS